LDIEKYSEGTPEIIEEYNDIEQAGLLKLKGYNYTEIAEAMGIKPKAAKALVDQYMQIIRYQAQNDPDFLDRVEENTIFFLKQFDDLSKEAWETVKISTDQGSLSSRINSLKLAGEFLTQKGKLLQLMGGKVDSSYIARMARAENVNLILASIIKEIISGCDQCRPEAHRRLQEAFAAMGSVEDAVDAEVINTEEA